MARLVLCLLVAMGFVSSTSARTWRVIKDGSGDFTTIVAAMDAIADGDTVEIHPGRYSGFRQISLPGQSGPASAFVTKNDITIRGTDRDAVIIGPETPNWSGYWPKGIVAKPGTTGLTIENLSIEHLREAIWLTGETTLYALNVRGSRFGVLAFLTGILTVADCAFANENGEGLSVSPPTSELRVTNSSFKDGSGIYLQAVSAQLDQVVLTCGGIGVSVTDGAVVQMRNCTSRSSGAASAIALDTDSSVHISKCILDGGTTNVWMLGALEVTGSENTLSGSTLASMLVNFPSNADLQRNDVLPAGGHAVRFYANDRPPITIDVRNNYWGVGTAQQVEDLIWHAPDGEPGVTGTALYEPFALRTVPVRPISFGELRALFAPR